MPKGAAYFRQKAEDARASADEAFEPSIRAMWEQLGKHFDYLADLSGRYDPRPEGLSAGREITRRLSRDP